MSPWVGGKLPAITLTRVDLPAPLSPMRPRTSPSSKVMSTSLSAWIAPKCFEIWRSSRTAPKRFLRQTASLKSRVFRNPRTRLSSWHVSVKRIGPERNRKRRRLSAAFRIPGQAPKPLFAEPPEGVFGSSPEIGRAGQGGAPGEEGRAHRAAHLGGGRNGRRQS